MTMNPNTRILLLRAACSAGFLASLAFSVSIVGVANQRIPQVTSQDVPIIQDGGFSATIAGLQRGRGTLMSASAFFFLLSAGCLAGAVHPYKQQHERGAVALLPSSLQRSDGEPPSHTTRLQKDQANWIQPATEQSVQTPEEQRRADLWQLILDHEGGWIAKLIGCPALLIYGGQGSGKTTMAASIALIRKLFGSHEIKVYDPHGHQNAHKWHGCEIIGGRLRYDEIAEGIEEYFAGLCDRTEESPPISRFWDELTNYATRVKSKQIGELLPSALSDARKARDFQVFIGHGPDLGLVGGPTRSGSHGMKQRGLVQLQLLFEENEIGDPYPAMRGVLFGQVRDRQGRSIDTPITIPSWLNPQQLIQWFPDLDYRVASGTEGMPQSRVYAPKTYPALERMWEISGRLDEFFHSGYKHGDSSGDKDGDSAGTGVGTPSDSPEIQDFVPTTVDFWVQGTWKQYFEMSELEMLATVRAAARRNTPGRTIVIKCFGCNKGDDRPKRHYSRVGIPAFRYLLQSNRALDLLAQYKDFLS